MEGTESTTRERTTAKDGNKAEDQDVLMSSKPMHRFVQRGPRSLGIAILIFGCAEVMMGFTLSGERKQFSSFGIYTSFWQGTLFLVCGNLSIYTDLRPSKKMVTVCLAMYVVSLLGIVVSVGYRINQCSFLTYLTHSHYNDNLSTRNRLNQVFFIEGFLCTCSLFVAGLLIFLSVIARLALKSTRTQIIVRHIISPPTDTTAT
ncbi:hypothetical protein PBY51_016056 [Eleginops maclovinus]|uniref:Uncharacterized protein n=1 Tax=Eleginops maclovinus TaxID=56733 RepID=A0AAN7XPF8_ELEMC|nr:hypothetical protein PBY51_016056 [Eleginops maclovinus]